MYKYELFFQESSETALHRAVINATSKSLPVVDFLIQNMPSQGLDKQTLPPMSSESSGCNTALHLCVIYNQIECMKLILRSGADPTIRNYHDKTPLDIAQQLNNKTSIELVIIIYES